MVKKKTNKSKSTTKKKPAEKDTKDLAKKEYTDEEKVRLANYLERANRKPIKFKSLGSNSGEPKIALKDSKDLLRKVKMLEALGTPESDLQTYLLSQVIHTFRGTVFPDGVDNDKFALACNYALSILNGIQPQDEIEGMLAVQMIGVHNMAMDCIGKATRTQWIDKMSTYMNGATKLLRAFAAQMEALNKYRSGGQQKIVVEHVNVNEGRQAIVGVVNSGGGGSKGSNDKKRG
ncbi:MAG: hypothetical protein ACYS9C_18090 [Planctomycetota bacterium]|jgi:hypothetical protein